MSTLEQTTYTWMKDLHSDTNPKTGYLVEAPKGAYGKKVKELVNYFSGQSVELKAIRHSRKIKPNACCLYGFYIFQFLSEYVFPIAFAVLASYFYYAWTPPEIVDDPPSFPSIENTTEIKTGWFSWIPNSDVAGQWVGSTVRSIVSIPLSFVVNVVDRGLHATEAMEAVQVTGTKLILLPLLFVAVYFLTKIVGRVLVHLQSLCASQRRVWDLQELLIRETEEALERAITGLCKPFLLKTYEEFLTLPCTAQSQQIVPTNQAITTLTRVYQHNYPLLQINLHDRLATEIKQIPFPELVRRGGLSQSYTQILHQLVRYADEELSSTLFTFHEEIHKVPTAIQSRFVDATQSVVQGTSRLASSAMILATAL